jgi:NAD(P)-dependent dehydrogenase (short-subunit alcohol dehydrogenase family)
MRTFRDLADLAGRVVLVTGGSGHVGRAVCDVLEELGASVVVADVADTVSGSGRRLLPVDLRDDDATRSLVPAVTGEFGRLDGVVHCAAYTGDTTQAGWAVPFSDQTVASWDDAHRVNLTSAFVLAQAAREPLTQSGHGSIVLISSIYGVVAPDFGLYTDTAMQNPAAYGTSKAGLLQLTRYLATAMAPAVRVNAVSPGGIARGQADVFVERYQARTPLGRMGTEEDLKGAVAFLTSDLSSYVTGTNLMVDGGWTAW